LSWGCKIFFCRIACLIILFILVNVTVDILFIMFILVPLLIISQRIEENLFVNGRAFVNLLSNIDPQFLRDFTALFLFG
jgi:hypothetical protein